MKQLVGEINYIKDWQRRINTTSGTKLGGVKACETNKRKYGNDWYAKIGKIGGSKTGLKGFALNNELAKSAGRKGGLKSRRGPGKRNKDGSVKHSYDYVVKHLRVNNESR